MPIMGVATYVYVVSLRAQLGLPCFLYLVYNMGKVYYCGTLCLVLGDFDPLNGEALYSIVWSVLLRTCFLWFQG